MRRIGVEDGDTLNLQWAYLRDRPPTGPVIGKAGEIAPQLPWANREAVLRRDKEICTIREEVQQSRSINRALQEGDGLTRQGTQTVG